MYRKPDREEALIGPSLYREERPSDHAALRRLFDNAYKQMCDFRRRPLEEIQEWQLGRLKALVKHAFCNVPLYKAKYSAVGFEPEDFKTWEDFAALPTLSKDELIAAWPDGCISEGYDTEFMTASSGSSGQFVYMAVDEAAIHVDTLQGARQADFQSGGAVEQDRVTINITTCFWWYSSIDGMYPVHFLPTRTPVKAAIADIKKLGPAVLAVYPSYLRELAVPLAFELPSHMLQLVITHSEGSTRKERDEISHLLKVPVLDEYSSEELTRIAIECPLRMYHVEEDACLVEIIHPDSLSPCGPNQQGEVVGTNLLNMATPFIRYRQGDLAAFTEQLHCPCNCTFRTIAAPRGRTHDSFVAQDGRVVPAGTVMDEAYNWVLEARIPVNGLQYQIIQRSVNEVQIFLAPHEKFRSMLKPAMRQMIAERMRALLGEQVLAETIVVDQLPICGRKHKAVTSTVTAHGNPASSARSH
jgi:phenylacetate-CoA ligase